MTDTLELRHILHIIWKRLWLIVLGTGLVASAVLVTSVGMRPVYRAKVTMKVDQPANAPLTYGSIATGQNLALTYSELLRTRQLLSVVIANLDLDTSPDALREGLGASLISGTPLLELTVEDTDAERAAEIANEIAFTFIALHNREQQLETITAFEEDVLAQVARLRRLIERNQALVGASSMLPGLLAPEASAPSAQGALATQQSTYASLLSVYLDIQLTQSQFYNVSVVDPAVAPVRPIRPQIPLYTFLGAALGFSLSLGAVFLVEYLDRSLKTGDDIRNVLSRPTLGIVPRLQGAGRNRTLVAWTAPYSDASEAFRALRTNIRFASVDRPLSTILIASAEPRAGKTTIAANLGIVCAQAGLRVAIVDTDLRLPSLHEAFGLGNVTGLTDLLLGNSQDVEACMQRTDVSGLRVIASGPIPPNPADLLGSMRMEDVLREVGQHADLVILDTAPVLPVTDAAVLAPKTDGVLLVVRANKTQREAVRHTAENLRQVGANVLGAVLNAAPRPRGSYYYYHRKTRRWPRLWPFRHRARGLHVPSSLVAWWRRLREADRDAYASAEPEATPTSDFAQANLKTIDYLPYTRLRGTTESPQDRQGTFADHSVGME